MATLHRQRATCESIDVRSAGWALPTPWPSTLALLEVRLCAVALEQRQRLQRNMPRILDPGDGMHRSVPSAGTERDVLREQGSVRGQREWPIQLARHYVVAQFAPCIFASTHLRTESRFELGQPQRRIAYFCARCARRKHIQRALAGVIAHRVRFKLMWKVD